MCLQVESNGGSFSSAIRGYARQGVASHQPWNETISAQQRGVCRKRSDCNAVGGTAAVASSRMPRFVITGGLGTGKTSVIPLLPREIETVPEPARELIAEHRAATGEPTLDHRPEPFVERLVQRSIENYRSASDVARTVFDRGLPDCVAYAAVYGIDTQTAVEAANQYRYETEVFVLHPGRRSTPQTTCGRRPTPSPKPFTRRSSLRTGFLDTTWSNFPRPRWSREQPSSQPDSLSGRK